MDLQIYQTLCAGAKIIWTKHCLERMQERDISRADVKNVIVTGEIIEEYPEERGNEYVYVLQKCDYYSKYNNPCCEL